MASDSVVSFLDLARKNRVLLPEYVEGLSWQQDIPQSSLVKLCDYLQNRGVLTHFQTELIRQGRGAELTFAGYPIIEELGPCPGGMAYRALHPSLRTPLILRRLRQDWFGPNDQASAFVQRVQQIAPITHPHLAHILDAGIVGDEAFVTQDPVDGQNLLELVRDIGPMPTPLASRYIAQAAQALTLVHSRGLVHGQVSPGRLVVGPLVPTSKLRPDGTPLLRPAASAKVVLTELGLSPKRPALSQLEEPHLLSPFESAYSAPECVDQSEPTPSADIYSLGASFYYLLTAHPPVPCQTLPQLIEALTNYVPPPIAQLRPDLPANLVSLIEAMISKSPAQRPTWDQVLFQLQASGMPTPVDTGTGSSLDVEPIPSSVDVDPVELTTDPANADAVQPDELAQSESAEALTWTVTPYSGDPKSGIGTFTPESYHGEGSSSADLATVSPVQPDASWPGFPSGVPTTEPATAGWPGFTNELPSQDSAFPPSIEPNLHPDALVGDDPVSGGSAPLRATAEPTKGNVWLWVGIGAGLQVLAVLGWIYLAMSPGCHSTPSPNPPKKMRS